jgi:hypothetical protein
VTKLKGSNTLTISPVLSEDTISMIVIHAVKWFWEIVIPDRLLWNQVFILNNRRLVVIAQISLSFEM